MYLVTYCGRQNGCVNCRSGSSTSSPIRSRDGVMFETSYVDYLRSARTSVQNCVNACRTWTAPYNGENPTIASFSDSHRTTSANHTAADENVKDGMISLRNGQVEVAAAADSRTVVIPLSDNTCPPSADGRITQAPVIPFPSFSPAANSLAPESFTDDPGVSLVVVPTNHSDSAVLMSSSSNQDTAPPGVPSGHLSAISTSDELESFFRQLSHVSSKSDSDDPTVDVLTEFDEVFSQLDTTSEDLESQKTTTAENPSVSDITENYPSPMENTEAIGESDSTETDLERQKTTTPENLAVLDITENSPSQAENTETVDESDSTETDLDSQKTITPEDPVVADFPEDSPSQAENTEAVGGETDSTEVVGAKVHVTDIAQIPSDSLVVEVQEGKILASEAGNDEDANKGDDDEDADLVPDSKTHPFSALLHCKYEPPYLPTIGTLASQLCVDLNNFRNVNQLIRESV